MLWEQVQCWLACSVELPTKQVSQYCRLSWFGLVASDHIKTYLETFIEISARPNQIILTSDQNTVHSQQYIILPFTFILGIFLHFLELSVS